MRRLHTACAAATILLLAACGQGGAGNDAGTNGEAESNLSAGTGAPSADLASLVGSNPRLVQLVEAAGMTRVLSGKEPYTLLVPTDAALNSLPATTFERLDQPEQKAKVTALLRAHILPGTILAADLARAVESGDGKATVATMAGEPVTVTRDGQAFVLTTAGGGSARIVGTERPAKNGVVHQVDKVLVTA